MKTIEHFEDDDDEPLWEKKNLAMPISLIVAIIFAGIAVILALSGNLEAAGYCALLMVICIFCLVFIELNVLKF